MKFRSFFAGAVALALTAFTGSAVMAADNTFQPAGASGAWHTAGNWSLNQVPTAADNVIVPANKTCNLDTSNGVADSFEIAATGVLSITGVSLTIDGSSDSSHSLNGTISLTNGSTSLLFVDRDHTLTGNGTISGSSGSLIDDEDPMSTDRELLIADNQTLALTGSLQVDLEFAVEGTVNASATVTYSEAVTIVGLTGGAYTATGSSTFNAAVANGGAMTASGASGLIDFNAAVSGGGSFSASAGEIEFSAASTSLSGNFSVTSGGLFDILADVATTGDLIAFSGSNARIIVAAGKVFQTS